MIFRRVSKCLHWSSVSSGHAQENERTWELLERGSSPIKFLKNFLWFPDNLVGIIIIIDYAYA